MRIVVFSMLTTFSLLASSLTLDDALLKVESNNLEVQIASYDIQNAQNKRDEIFSLHYGSLDFIQDAVRSNDAGNVFGFKLTSREASFGDFGFSEFSTPTTPQEGAALLKTQPEDLNNPDTRNFFQSKLHYEVPLFTGFELSSYSEILSTMVAMKRLDKEALLSKKMFELKKSFYNYHLLEKTANKLAKIHQNVAHLKETTKEMIDVGYAKNMDLLEVDAKLSDISRLEIEVNSNKELLKHYISFLVNEKVESVSTSDLKDLENSDVTIKEILNSNIDVKKVDAAIKMSKAGVTLQRSNYLPKVGAFAEVATADDTFLGSAKDHKAWSVGARLKWNLFSGFSDSAKIESAKVDLLKRETSLLLVKEGISLKARKIKTEILNDISVIKHLQKELALYKAISENYSERYKEKLVSINDVLIKHSQEIAKSLELLKAENLKNEHLLTLEKLYK